LVNGIGAVDVMSFNAVVKLYVLAMSLILPVLPLGKTYLQTVALFKKLIE
jgi:hypothetical protein